MRREVCPPYSLHLWATLVSSWLTHAEEICNNANFNFIVPFCDVMLWFSFPNFHYWHSTQLNAFNNPSFCHHSSCLSFQFAQFCIYTQISYMVYTFWIYSCEFTKFCRRARSADNRRRLVSWWELPMKNHVLKGKAFKLKKGSPSDMSCLEGEKSTLTPEVLLNCELSENLSP
jgi:hypothetical protein